MTVRVSPSLAPSLRDRESDRDSRVTAFEFEVAAYPSSSYDTSPLIEPGPEEGSCLPVTAVRAAYPPTAAALPGRDFSSQLVTRVQA